ncbi:hypothetical protein D9M69_187550 [compost metagenome]|uniref:hypothetical protein n=1 Tax=Sinorhizobium/Ensifer group TaxID=227292 RepID=UPI00071CA402|nr:hypothetical protein [Sinorhizobium sp. Sb3]KSV69851.1 membrane protein [Sinorhizobium sp. Sb3]
MAKDLKAGFTGKPIEPPTGPRKVAKTAADAVSREANAAAVGAADHPYTAAGLTLAVGLLAFAIGYVMGRSSVDSEQSYWR